MLSLFAPGLNAEQFCERLREIIGERGFSALFGDADSAILYSGPEKAIKDACSVRDNVKRSKDQADQLGASRIDDTPLGKFLLSCDFQTYFRSAYGNDKARIEKAISELWSCASREFVKSGFKHVATAVCGAAANRVFRAHELKVLLTEETPVETINGVALHHFKEIYKPHGEGDKGFYAAFVEICRSELDVAYTHTLTAKPEERDVALENYNARKLFFDLEQTLSSGPCSPDIAFPSRRRIEITI